MMAPSSRQQSKIWAITCYFRFDDPPGEKRRQRAYREFRRRLQVPLVTVELSLDGVFDLGSNDADILMQLKGGDILWQKERLLNTALQALPPECDTVAWIDCDVALERDDWPEATRDLLENHGLVQPFRFLHFLGEDETPETYRALDPASVRECVVARWLRGELPVETFRRSGASQRLYYAPGMAWAARRALLEQHGFYDSLIMGSGDKAMFAASCGQCADIPRALRMSEEHRLHYLRWAESFYQSVRGNVGYLEGNSYHFWHGDLASRRYGEKYRDFDHYRFDPETDLRLTESSVWAWDSEKPALHETVRTWFARRVGLKLSAAHV